MWKSRQFRLPKLAVSFTETPVPITEMTNSWSFMAVNWTVGKINFLKEFFPLSSLRGLSRSGGSKPLSVLTPLCEGSQVRRQCGPAHTGQDTARVQVKGEDLGGNAPTQTLGEHV